MPGKACVGIFCRQGEAAGEQVGNLNHAEQQVHDTDNSQRRNRQNRLLGAEILFFHLGLSVLYSAVDRKEKHHPPEKHQHRPHQLRRKDDMTDRLNHPVERASQQLIEDCVSRNQKRQNQTEQGYAHQNSQNDINRFSTLFLFSDLCLSRSPAFG